MTGTADTEAVEFKKIYKLDVVVVPPNQKMVRNDQPDVVYKTEREKFNAVVDEIAECHERGQPVLVGTISVEKSEHLSKLLKKRGIKHNVLNAVNHEAEANIIAQAGRFKTVTIATNMAGRGTDILLGGNPEFLARAEMENDWMRQAATLPEGGHRYEDVLQKLRDALRRGGAAGTRAVRAEVAAVRGCPGRSARAPDRGASRLSRSRVLDGPHRLRERRSPGTPRSPAPRRLGPAPRRPARTAKRCRRSTACAARTSATKASSASGVPSTTCRRPCTRPPRTARRPAALVASARRSSAPAPTTSGRCRKR